MQNRQLAEQAAVQVRLGLGANWQQFCLLVLINAFVGGMVGLERTIVPLMGPQEFHIASATVVASFVIKLRRCESVDQLDLRATGGCMGPKAGVGAWLVHWFAGPFHDHLGS
jgi:hypothetical protein